jgi:hypothetical protein
MFSVINKKYARAYLITKQVSPEKNIVVHGRRYIFDATASVMIY